MPLSVTKEAITKILDRIPPKQHKQATDRIRAAEVCGWHSITLFVDGDAPADQLDLVGLDAQDRFGFLP